MIFGLNGSSIDHIGFPFIDMKKIGNAVFTVSEASAHEQVFTQQVPKLYAPLRDTVLVLDNQTLIEHGKIVF